MWTSTRMRGAAWSRLVALGGVVVIVAFAGCGVTPGAQAGTSGAPTNTASANTTASATTPPSATASATISASASTGCPGPAESVSWPTPPTVVVTQPQGTISVKVGQTLELRLAFGHRWSVAASMLNGTFALDQPAGYADAQTQTCDWHFTAKHAGSQNLTIAMAPNCQASKACAQAIVAYDLTITATA